MTINFFILLLLIGMTVARVILYDPFKRAADLDVEISIEPFEKVYPYEEELLLLNVRVNYYFGLLLFRYFGVLEEAKPVLDLIDKWRKRGKISLTDIRTTCRKYHNRQQREICKLSIFTWFGNSDGNLFSPADQLTFAWEEMERKRLKANGHEIVNTGKHAGDILRIINYKRGGKIDRKELQMYYVKRYRTYRKIYTTVQPTSILMEKVVWYLDFAPGK